MRQDGDGGSAAVDGAAVWPCLVGLARRRCVMVWGPIILPASQNM